MTEVVVEAQSLYMVTQDLWRSSVLTADSCASHACAPYACAPHACVYAAWQVSKALRRSGVLTADSKQFCSLDAAEKFVEDMLLSHVHNLATKWLVDKTCRDVYARALLHDALTTTHMADGAIAPSQLLKWSARTFVRKVQRRRGVEPMHLHPTHLTSTPHVHHVCTPCKGQLGDPHGCICMCHP